RRGDGQALSGDAEADAAAQEVVRHFAAWAALLCASSLARAAAPAVAGFPFTGLSGARGAGGGATRGTVSCDPRGGPGWRAVERAAVDRVGGGEALSAQGGEVDGGATVKVGKLLGASLLVLGAYQRSGESVRLTARFIAVETGEVVGTAKVDGAASGLLALED